MTNGVEKRRIVVCLRQEYARCHRFRSLTGRMLASFLAFCAIRVSPTVSGTSWLEAPCLPSACPLVMAHSATSGVLRARDRVDACGWLVSIGRRPAAVHALVLAILLIGSFTIFLVAMPTLCMQWEDKQTLLDERKSGKFCSDGALIRSLAPRYESFWLGPRLETMWSTFRPVSERGAQRLPSRLTSTWDGWGGDRANFDSPAIAGPSAPFACESHLWRTALSLRPTRRSTALRGRIQVLDSIWMFLLLAIIAANGAAADPKSG